VSVRPLRILEKPALAGLLSSSMDATDGMSIPYELHAPSNGLHPADKFFSFSARNQTDFSLRHGTHKKLFSADQMSNIEQQFISV
jgi:hypothetical protein